MILLLRALFAAAVVIHAVLVCLQPLLAGWSLDGDGIALEMHGIIGGIIMTVSMVLVPLAVLWWRPCRGSIWAPVLAAVLLVGETFQLGMGYADILILHVPLGVGIVIGSLLLCRIVFRGFGRASGRRPRDRVTAQV